MYNKTGKINWSQIIKGFKWQEEEFLYDPRGNREFIKQGADLVILVLLEYHFDSSEEEGG